METHEVASVNEGLAFERLVELQPDAIVVVSFGQILRKDVLRLPRHGCLNLHPSMLPQYRGAAPVQRAVMDGLRTSGLTVMKLVRKLDAGPILRQRPWPLDPARNAGELLEEAGELGAAMMIDVLETLDRGETLVETPQEDAQATFAPPLEKGEGRLDFARPAQEIVDRIRGVQPWPRAFAMLDPGDDKPRRVLVHRATVVSTAGESSDPGSVLELSPEGLVVACGEGSLRVELMQLEGRAVQRAADAARGLRLGGNARFRSVEENG